MPPAIIAGGIAAAGTIGGAALSSSAQKKASKQASNVALQTANSNNALAREIYGKNQTNLSPFMGFGTTAGNALMGEVGKGPHYDPLESSFVNSGLNPGSFEDWKKNAGYDWNLDQGLKGIGIQAGGGGWLQSGAAIKGALDFQTNLGSREWQNYRNALDRYTSYSDAWKTGERGYATDQYNNWLGLLSNQQGVGLGAASALAGVGQNYVNTVSANNNSAGTAAANAALARGAASADMYSGIGNALGQFAGAVFPGAPRTPTPQYGYYGV